MRIVHGEVVKATQTGRLDRVFKPLMDNFARSSRDAPTDLIACSRGCSHCCHMWVSATAPEILLIASYVQRNGQDLARIQERVKATRGMDFDARGRFVAPCPMLADDGSCSVYDVRPLACRTAVSADAGICRRAYMELSPEQIPSPLFFPYQRAMYGVIFRGAFKKAGFPLHSYELNDGIEVALSVDDADRRWLAGEDVFANVQRDPADDPMDQQQNRWLYQQAFAGWP